MGTKYFFIRLSLGILMMNMVSQADISSPHSAGLSGPNQDDKLGLNTISSMGDIAAEPDNDSVGMMDLGDSAGSAQLSVKLNDEESKKQESGEFVDVLISTSSVENHFDAEEASIRADFDAENLDDIDGFWKRKLMFITQPSSIGIIVALGVGVIWIRRKLLL